MAIIYSYPITNNIQSTDLLLGVSTVMYNGKPKNQTKSFELGELANFLATLVAPLIPPGATPNLQQVLTVGDTANKTITINALSGNGAILTSVNASGVFASTNSGFAGVYGEHSGTGFAGYFATDNGTALVGTSDIGNAIIGSTNEGVGVSGSSVNGNGGTFISEAGVGIYATSIDNVGVRGISATVYGGYFSSDSDSGIVGTSLDSHGVSGSSTFDIGGYFSIGPEGSYSLVAAQSAAKPGGGGWTAYSDARVKENIKPYTKGLAEILLVNPVNYEYNGLAGTTKGTEYTGVIAQEIKDIFPETVSTYKAKLNETDEEKTELYDFTSTALTFALINAVKELNERIKTLENK